MTAVGPPPSLPRLVAIMGSGETSPTMVKVHRELFARLGPDPVPAVLLDTPYGFQNNAADISARIQAYFTTSLQRDLAVASLPWLAEKAGTTGPTRVQRESALNRLRQARYVFAGPGSPSYAARQWLGTPVPVLLADKVAEGGCVCFASAAAMTLGRFVVPVYEIYKAGAPLHWLEGLDLLATADLNVAVIPHFNNAEGGTHDTRYCYLGEPRLSVMEEMLPDDAFILGVDEHTACILDVGAGTATVAGLGGVTARRHGLMCRIEPGNTVSLADLRALGFGSLPATTPRLTPTQPTDVNVPALARSPLLDDVANLEKEFHDALGARDPSAAVDACFRLGDLLLAWSRDVTQSDEMDRAQASLRSMMAQLGDLAQLGMDPRRELLEPFVDALLDARDSARAGQRWAEADAIRARLDQAGVAVRDLPDGTHWELRGGTGGQR